MCTDQSKLTVVFTYAEQPNTSPETRSMRVLGTKRVVETLGH